MEDESFDELDPFEDSGSDYFPPSVRSLSSTSDDSSSSIGNFHTARRSLHFDQELSTIIEDDSIQEKSSGPSGIESFIDTSATIVVTNEVKVAFTVTGHLHHGTYNLQMFNSFDNDGFKILLGFTKKSIQDITQDTCVFRPEIIPCYVVLRNNDLAELSVKQCLERCSLHGELSTVSNLSMCALTLDSSHLPKEKPLRSKTKRNYCPFCNASTSAFARHVLQYHADKEEVVEIIALPKKSKDRLAKLVKLRRRGNATYNHSVDPNERIPVRMPKKSKMASTIECPNCNGLFVDKLLARHHLSCTGREKNRTRVLQEARDKRLDNLNINNSLRDRLLAKLLNSLRDDQIGQLIRVEKSILLLATRLAVKHRSCDNYDRNDRQYLRWAARLLITVKKVDPNIDSYEVLLKTKNYDKIIDAVGQICGNDKMNQFTKPTVVNMLRLVIIEITNSLRSHYIKSGYKRTDNIIVELDEFDNLHRKDFLCEIGKSAYVWIKRSELKKNVVLPSNSDIRKFSQYLNNFSETAYDRLTRSGFDYFTWLRLGTVLLLQIIIFNRRRPGEVSRMQLCMFKSRSKISEADYQFMTRLEQILAASYQRVLIIAKRLRKLPVLLTNDQVQYLECFVKFLVQAGVQESNEYLFGHKGHVGYIDACAGMRRYANECGVDEPRLLRATLLRKQVATTAKFLSLNNSELKELANFMGHQDSVHFENYRQCDDLQDITTFSQFLKVVGDPDISRFRGKTLKQIQEMEPLEKIIDEEEDEVFDALREEFMPDDPLPLFQDDIGNNTSRVETQLEEPKEKTPIKKTSQITRIKESLCKDDSSSLFQDEIINTSRVETESQEKNKTPIKRTRQVRTPIKQSLRQGKIHGKYIPLKECTVNLKRLTPVKKISRTPNKPKAKSPKIKSILQVLDSGRRIRTKRQRWSSQEVQLILKTFSEHFNRHKMPTLEQLEEFIQINKNIFEGRRTARMIYAWIQYRIKNSSMSC